VGSAFLIVAAVAWWRGHAATAGVAAALAALLFLAALAIPERMVPVEAAWMRMAHLISMVTAPLLLGVVYFAAVTPLGLVRRIVGKNPLVHRPRDGGYWATRPPEQRRSPMDRQF
jgi:hypothetical protein